MCFQGIMVEKHKGLRNTRDRISNLPDEVLTHILSFLSTKNVVRTSVLSRRWKPLWVCVPTLDLAEFDFSSRGRYPYAVKQRQHKFLAFIYEFLLQGGFSRITRFCLHCWSTYDERLVRSWVNFAKKNNVQELSINTSFYESSRRKGKFFIKLCKVYSFLRDGNNSAYVGTLHLKTTDRFILDSWMCVVTEWNMIELHLDLTYWKRQELLPCLPFGILVDLKLNSVFLNFPKASVWFPKLKVLHFRYVKFGNDGSASDLINSSCPVLEELEIYGYGLGDIQNLTINSKTLKRLVMDEGADEEFHTIIDAPNLQYLHVSGRVEAYVFKDLSLLEKAKLNFRSENDCLHHLRMIKHVRYLRLSYIAMWILDSITIDLPTFENLTCLKLGFRGEEDEFVPWNVMEAFLQKVPMLKDFISPEALSIYFLKQDYELTTHHNVPSCLVYELETIKFHVFEPTDMNLRFVEYILKNSKVLKLMEIFLYESDGCYDIDKVEGTIQAFPKASSACVIRFG